MEMLRVTSVGYRVLTNLFLFIILFITLHVTHYALNDVNAQSVDLSISPPLVELLIKPGKSALIAYTVGNGENPIVLSSHVGTFSPRGINGQINLDQEILGPIRFNLENSDAELTKSVYIKSDQKQQFLLKIRVPNNTAEGDYYYTFYVKSDSGPLFTGQNISKSTATIGSNILITVSSDGQTDTKGRISEFKLIGNKGINILGKRRYFVESSSKIPISLIVENTGRNLIKPNGVVTMSGPLGTLGKHKVTPVNILTKSQRTVPATPSAQFDLTQSNLNPSLVLSGFFIGPHTVNAKLNFGDTSALTSANIEFIAIPTKLISGMIFLLIIFIIIVKRLKKPTVIE